MARDSLNSQEIRDALGSSEDSLQENADAPPYVCTQTRRTRPKLPTPSQIIIGPRGQIGKPELPPPSQAQRPKLPTPVQTIIGPRGQFGRPKLSSPSQPQMRGPPPVVAPTPENSNWKKKVPGKTPHSLVWNYFVYDKSLDTSTCKIGTCTNSNLRGRHTTNLKKHLERFHDVEHNIVVAGDKETVKKVKKVPDANLTGQLHMNNLGKLIDVKYDKSSGKQIRFSRQIAICFGANPIPNSFVINEDFKKCFDIADSRLSLPDRQALKKLIDGLMTEVSDTIVVKLNSTRRINLSADIWTKKGMSSSYLGVLATFYNYVEKKKMNIVLGVKVFESVRHTAADVTREMTTVLGRYGISVEKIWKSMTDSGSNMVAAFRDSIYEAMDEPSESDILEEISDEIENDVDECEDTSDNTELNSNRIPCFIHTLLLCLKKFDARKVFENLVASVKKMVHKFSSSQVLTGELLRLSGLKVVSFSSTRWNTTFLVFDRIIILRKQIIRVMQLYKKEKHGITESEWILAIEVRDFLLPFNKYTDMASTEGTRTFSELTMMLKQLKLHLQKYSTKFNFVQLSKSILLDIDTRFGHYLDENASKPFDGIYLASTLPDPRYRIGLTIGESELGKKYILELGWHNNDVTAIEDENANRQSPSNKRKYEFLEGIERNSNSIQTRNLRQEIDAYIQMKAYDVSDDKFDPYDFWQQRESNGYRKLAPIALDVLSLPLSTGAVERVFSYAGLATAGRRNRPEGSNLEREMLLSKNKLLLSFH